MKIECKKKGQRHVKDSIKPIFEGSFTILIIHFYLFAPKALVEAELPFQKTKIQKYKKQIFFYVSNESSTLSIIQSPVCLFPLPKHF